MPPLGSARVQRNRPRDQRSALRDNKTALTIFVQRVRLRPAGYRRDVEELDDEEERLPLQVPGLRGSSHDKATLRWQPRKARRKKKADTKYGDATEWEQTKR